MCYLQKHKEQQKEANFDSQKLASARKRLQENYKEAENGLATPFFFFPFTSFSDSLGTNQY